MSTAEKVLVAAVALVLGVVVYLELAGRPSLRLELGVDVDGHEDPDQYWLCQPSDLRTGARQRVHPHAGRHRLGRRHPLYRRPDRARPAHAELAANGWRAWALRPPSEER